jgi:VWFA-related protein
MRQPSFRSYRLLLVLGLAIIASLAVPLAAQQAGAPPFQVPPATGERLIVLFFDVAITEPDDVRRATAAGVQFVNEAMTNADSLAVVTIGTRLSVVKDFTSSREELRTALESPGLLNETAPDVGALGRNPISQTADAATSVDVRLRALTTLCQTLASVQQRKTVVYFTSVMNRAAAGELRAVTNACIRGNVAIYPVDARGLRAGILPVVAR